MLCASQTFGHRRTCAIGRSSDAGTTDESCGMYSSFAYSYKATTVCALTSNRIQSRKSKCVWVSASIIVNYLWSVAHRKHSTTEYKLQWQCEYKWVGGTVHASRLPIPDGFWVMWEGPPYHSHSLGDGSERHHGKGLKTVCIAPRCTSESIFMITQLRCDVW
jgi:hypothetical protein